MSKRDFFAVAALLGALSSTPSYAGNFFVGANAGTSQLHGVGYAASVGIFAGYAFDRFVNMELGYNRLGTWTGADQGTPYTTAINNVDFSLAAGPWLTRHIQLYGRLGFDDWSTIGTAGGGEHRVTGSSASNDMIEELHQVFYGVGLAYHLSRSIGLRLEYRHYRPVAVNGHGLDISSILLGASYHF
jgi:hypothetical protein